jgi:hypothetical protein
MSEFRADLCFFSNIFVFLIVRRKLININFYQFFNKSFANSLCKTKILLYNFNFSEVLLPGNSALLLPSAGPGGRIFKILKSPGIDSKELTPPGWESIPGLLKRFTKSGSVLLN